MRTATLAPVPGRGTRRHAIRIPDELWRAALAKATERGEQLSAVIRTALERYVEDDDSSG